MARTARNAVEREVLDATNRCLAAGETFTALGVQRICAEAGVSRSAFYVNFTDKTDLLLRLVADSTGDLFDTAVAFAESTGGREEMAAAHLNTVRVWRRSAPLLKAYFEVAAYEPALAALWDDRMLEVVAAMEARVKRSPCTLPARATAEFIVYGFERRTAQHVASAPKSRDKRFAQEITDIGWTLMYGPGS